MKMVSELLMFKENAIYTDNIIEDKENVYTDNIIED